MNRKNFTPTEPKQLRKDLSERDGSHCHYCGKKLIIKSGKSGTQIDHVIPVTKGGKDELDNLVLSCKGCNRRKGNKDYDDFIEYEYNRLTQHLDIISKRRK